MRGRLRIVIPSTLRGYWLTNLQFAVEYIHSLKGNEMTKSEKLMAQFDAIEALLESAMGKLTKLPVELVNQSSVSNIYEIIGTALEDLETEKYESCCGLQQEEEETLEKIEKMEAELFELRASLR